MTESVRESIRIGDRVRTTHPVPGVGLDITPIGSRGTVAQVESTSLGTLYVRFDDGRMWWCGRADVEILGRVSLTVLAA